MGMDPAASIGPYRLERLLGQGGMGEVWLATDADLARPVALKLLPAHLASDDRFRVRFLAESRVAASLDHPHIVPIYEAGEANGRLFIAMRYVEGRDLGTLIESEGALGPNRTIALLGGIADALDAAHDRGLVHRDVKPGNILVASTSRRGEHAYLADFGLVKQLSSSADFTQSGQILGSLGYVAPEQIEGRPIDARSDVYSLTCVLYEALTGRPPFAAERDVATLWAHLQATRPRPSALESTLARFDAVVTKGMAVDPADRFASAGELLDAARTAADATDAAAEGPAVPRHPTPTAAKPAAPIGASSTGRSRRRLAGVAGAALVVGVVVVGALLAPRVPVGGPSASGAAGSQRTGAAPSDAAPSAVVASTLDIGPLAAGTYRTSVFERPLEFDVPAGWSAGLDAGYAGEGSDRFELFRTQRPTDRLLFLRKPTLGNAPCSETSLPGVRDSFEAAKAWVAAYPGISVGSWSVSVSPTSPAGVLEQYQVDITAGAEPGCKPSLQPPRVPGRDVFRGDYLYSIPPNGSARLTVIRDNSDQLVFAIASSFEPEPAFFASESDQIVRTIRPSPAGVGPPVAGADGVRALGAGASEPGRYRDLSLKPPLEFTIPAGWEAHRFANGLDLSTRRDAGTKSERTARLWLVMSRLMLDDPACGDQFVPVQPGVLDRILRDPSSGLSFKDSRVVTTAGGVIISRFGGVAIVDRCPDRPGGGWHPLDLSGLESASTIWAGDLPDQTAISIGLMYENGLIDTAQAEADQIVASLALAPPAADLPAPVLALPSAPLTDLLPITWHIDSLGPPFALHPDDGWRVDANVPGHVVLASRGRFDQQILEFARSTKWMTGECGRFRPDGTNARASIEANRGLVADFRQPSQAGRVEVTRIDLSILPGCGRGPVPLFRLADGSTVEIVPGRRYRLYLVTAEWLGGPDRPLAILLNAAAESHLVALVQALEPMLIELSPA